MHSRQSESESETSERIGHSIKSDRRQRWYRTGSFFFLYMANTKATKSDTRSATAKKSGAKRSTAKKSSAARPAAKATAKAKAKTPQAKSSKAKSSKAKTAKAKAPKAKAPKAKSSSGKASKASVARRTSATTDVIESTARKVARGGKKILDKVRDLARKA